MGTRASFWIGDPANLEQREWLGCIAWDGYPQNFQYLARATTEVDFRAEIRRLTTRRDFAAPAKGWPFPWEDDLFLTDYTYAFFDGAVQCCCFHTPFVCLADYDSDAEGEDDPRHIKVPGPSAYNSAQPDSIMIMRINR